MSPPRRRRVVLVQRMLPHYRIEPWNRLAAALARRDIDFEVHAGQPLPGERLVDGRSEVPCCAPLENVYLPGGPWWQTVLARLKGADLVILEQANGALVNLPLLIGRATRRALGRDRQERDPNAPPGFPRLAYYGHGAHLQAPEGPSLRKSMKRALLRGVDYWFAYTALSRDIVTGAGFPPERVSVVENSQATLGLRLSPEERRAVRAGFGMGEGPLAVFCGRLAAQKRIPLVVAGCAAARALGPDLGLVVIGEGPFGGWLADAAAAAPWIRPVGARFGEEKARILAAADLFVMPTGMGLSVLDAFAAGLPVATTTLPGHNPEIVYVEDGRNGIVARPAASAAGHAPQALGAAIAALAADPVRRAALAAGARAASARYTVENMVGNFVGGIEAALDPSVPAPAAAARASA